MGGGQWVVVGRLGLGPSAEGTATRGRQRVLLPGHSRPGSVIAVRPRPGCADPGWVSQCPRARGSTEPRDSAGIPGRVLGAACLSAGSPGRGESSRRPRSHKAG